LFERLLEEEFVKLRAASNRDVHDDSKNTTLPIARAIVKAYVTSDVKTPWYVDLLNINLDNYDLATAEQRIARYLETFRRNGIRITENQDF
jgi:malate synthase